MSMQAVEAPKEPTQLDMGWEPAMTRFSLRSANNLVTDEDFKPYQAVRGTFTGRVVGQTFRPDKDESWVRVWLVEVNDCTLTGA